MLFLGGSYMQPKKHYHQTPLLKRLQQERPKRMSHSDWVYYVAEALGYLLNARHGAAPACECYGLPDFNEFTHTPGQMLKNIERNMLKAIEMYEPRLKQVKVLGVMDEEFPDRMRFSISGVLALGDEQYRVNYQSLMTPGGRVVVKV